MPDDQDRPGMLFQPPGEPHPEPDVVDPGAPAAGTGGSPGPVDPSDPAHRPPAVPLTLAELLAVDRRTWRYEIVAQDVLDQLDDETAELLRSDELIDDWQRELLELTALVSSLRDENTRRINQVLEVPSDQRTESQWWTLRTERTLTGRRKRFLAQVTARLTEIKRIKERTREVEKDPKVLAREKASQTLRACEVGNFCALYYAELRGRGFDVAAAQAEAEGMRAGLERNQRKAALRLHHALQRRVREVDEYDDGEELPPG